MRLTKLDTLDKATPQHIKSKLSLHTTHQITKCLQINIVNFISSSLDLLHFSKYKKQDFTSTLHSPLLELNFTINTDDKQESSKDMEIHFCFIKGEMLSNNY